jgi:hypothetical protein
MGNFSSLPSIEAPADFLAELDATLSGPSSAETGDAAAVDVEAPLSDNSPFDDSAAAEEIPEEIPAEEPAQEPEAEPEAPPVEEEAPPAEPSPDGVKTYERNGKQFVSATKERWNHIYPMYQVAKESAKVLGEPLTIEALQEREGAYQAQILMREDLISGDPEQQANFIAKFLVHESKQAVQNGEVGADPLLSFASTLPEVLQAAHPQAFEALTEKSLRAGLDALYEQAAASGDENLMRSVQWIDKARFNTFRKADEVKATVSARSTAPRESEEVVRLRQQIAERDQQDAATSYQSWTGDTNQAIHSAVDALVSEKLKESGAEEQFKQFPETLKDLRESLHRVVGEGLRENAHWKRNRDIELRQAQRAVSPQRRDAIRQTLITRATNAARLSLDGRMASVLEEFGKKVATSSAARHARLQGGAQQRAPGSAATPGRTAVAPSQSKSMDAFNSPEDFVKELSSILG